MIYMEPHQLGWKPLKDSYMETLPSSLTEEHRELVRPPSLPVPLGLPFIAMASGHIFTFMFQEARRGREFPVCLQASGCLAACQFSDFLFPVVGMRW